MAKSVYIFAAILILVRVRSVSCQTDDVSVWLDNIQTNVTQLSQEKERAEWTYFINATDTNLYATARSRNAFLNFVLSIVQNASSKQSGNNVTQKRLDFWKTSPVITPSVVQKQSQARSLELSMLGELSKAVRIAAGAHNTESVDYGNLLDNWKNVRDIVSANISHYYQDYINVSSSLSSAYDVSGLMNATSEVFEVYQHLQTFVRKQLGNLYGPDKIPASGHIPAHLIDSESGVWWGRVFPTILPFKYADQDLITLQKLSVEDILQYADQFYQSLGYLKLPDSFWNYSLIREPTTNSNITVLCLPPTAWLFQQNDVRLSSCLGSSRQSMRSAVETIHGLQVLRYQQNLPYELRQSVDDDMVLDAVAGALSLAFFTPAHLKNIGFIRSTAAQPQGEVINFLLEVALTALPPFAWSYAVNEWQKAVALKQTSAAGWNKEWWKLRCEYEGVSPPVYRPDSGFDIGVSTDVLLNVPGKRYLEKTIAQFQILKSLCVTAGFSGGLADCNIRNSAAVGDKIRNVTRQGQLLSIGDKLRVLTGSDRLDATAMLEYLQPLTNWFNDTPQSADIRTTACPDPYSGKVRDAFSVQAFLDRYEIEGTKAGMKAQSLSWNQETNITDYNQELEVKANFELSQIEKRFAWEAAMYDIDHLDNATQRRMLKKISNVGVSALRDEEKLLKFKQIVSNMTSIYGTARVCLNASYCIPLDPDVTNIMATSRNYSELATIWKLWHDATGPKLKISYEDYVRLGNEGAQQAGYADMGEYWRSGYEEDSFMAELEALLMDLHPLYQQLHTYVRHRLQKVYGEEHFPTTGHIPAHLLGNMWAQQWNNIFDIVVPFPNKTSVDVTGEMVRQNYSVEKMFRAAEEFYTSIGLSKMVDTFWNKSMLVRPVDGRDVVCHASAWDFFDGKDFRIKMCTVVTMQDLIVIHHEMGHVEYYMQYKDQPYIFREGANPGFHEAIGDVIALSVSTPAHLNKIGLLPVLESDNETEINFLLKMALEKVAFLPFGYLIDQWRWSVFSGETTSDHYNSKWWELRCKHQGISPPVDRTEDDFDPASKFHVDSNVPYIRYFVSYILQFQFHKALCEAANHTGPLHNCDIYRSTTAGALFKDMLRKGSSQPWQDILQAFNGQRAMNATAILEYFQPLTKWLAIQNAGLPVGWANSCPPGSTEKIRDESLANEWLQNYSSEGMEIISKLSFLSWNYETNVTDENQNEQVQESLEVAAWEQKKASEADHFDWKNFADESLERQFHSATDIGTSAMKNATKLKRMEDLQSTMEGIYAKAKVCNGSSCLTLEPDLTRLMSDSRDYNQLLWAWKGWRDATGPLMKKSYAEFAALSNEAVQLLGYADTGAYWRSFYESDTFRSDVEALLDQLKPLYLQLHTYVRRKLQEKYSENKFPYSGHIPAHLLGSMWAQEWGNIYDLVEPFRNKTAIDVTPELINQHYTVRKMFTTAEDFFVSLGLEPMPTSFWQDSMLEKPSDGRDVVCHASAWDFSNGKDFRIKMCTDITMEDLITIHHEMGHIQYYLQYKKQPFLFQGGANPGFHEAIGDTLALSVSTPAHLFKIQLLPSLEEDNETTINYLMKMALDKIAFLPFGYLIDQWRWSVFSGETTQDHYNDKWWELRCKYQGISPPVGRNSSDFDPGAKYHVPANTPYIRYFVSHVLQFQFYAALCKASGHTGPLHSCDFYNSKQAGQLLSNMLQLGSSKPWPEALKQMTGTHEMDVRPLVEYFQPLLNWLKEQNDGQVMGWTEECPQPQLVAADQWLTNYNHQLEGLLIGSNLASWNYETNLTDENSRISVNTSVQLATFQRRTALEAQQLGWQNLSDISIRRQFQFLTDIGPSALNSTKKFEQMQTLQSQMENIYGSAAVCLDPQPNKCLSLEPDLEDILANNRDYNRLLAVWTGWRNATGRLMRPLYQDFVALSNEGVQQLGYADTGEYWRGFYESKTFQSDLEALWKQLSPLYTQLHAYVRHKLQKTYGKDKFPSSGHIPAHLLGNMWAQDWSNIYNLVQPYPNRTAVDVTQAMVDQKYNVSRMFRTAEDFFMSLGLEPMPGTFWADSMLEKPADGRNVVCHASAWDFYNAKDFRIKMCTYVTMDYLIIIHHEMGHIQYYLQYRHQPQMFRDGANPGFHEAIGDTIALSVSTLNHLRKIKLLQEGTDNHLDEINFLLKMALQKIAFLPFGYLIDQWRWSVFSGETTSNNYNNKWWKLRCQYQGISPPVQRTEADFDPGAKFHIPGNTPYIRYFVSYVLQFQFHQALCRAAGHTGPLHHCDIYQSAEAGRLLRAMLSKGKSLPWPDVLEQMTGVRYMDAGALLNYFQPLTEWLENENAQELIGWTQNCPNEFSPSDTSQTTQRPKVNSSGTKLCNNNCGLFIISFIIFIHFIKIYL